MVTSMALQRTNFALGAPQIPPNLAQKPMLTITMDLHGLARREGITAHLTRPNHQRARDRPTGRSRRKSAMAKPGDRTQKRTPDNPMINLHQLAPSSGNLHQLEPTCANLHQLAPLHMEQTKIKLWLHEIQTIYFSFLLQRKIYHLFASAVSGWVNSQTK